MNPYLEVSSRLEAPIEKNQVVGKVRIQLDGEDFRVLDLVALEDVKEGGIVRKISDYIMGYFE